MKATITTSLRTAFVALAGLGTYLFNHGLIDPDAVSQVNDSGATLGDALGVVAAALVARLIWWLGEKVKTGGSVPVFALLSYCVLGTLVAGGLSACHGVPVSIGVRVPNGSLSYGSKSGLSGQVKIKMAGSDEKLPEGLRQAIVMGAETTEGLRRAYETAPGEFYDSTNDHKFYALKISDKQYADAMSRARYWISRAKLGEKLSDRCFHPAYRKLDGVDVAYCRRLTEASIRERQQLLRVLTEGFYPRETAK